jgi:hypothetical protein
MSMVHFSEHRSEATEQQPENLFAQAQVPAEALGEPAPSAEGGAEGLTGRRKCPALSARRGIYLGTFSRGFTPGYHIAVFQPSSRAPLAVVFSGGTMADQRRFEDAAAGCFRTGTRHSRIPENLP